MLIHTKNVYKSVYRLYGVSISDRIEQLLDTVSSIRVELSHVLGCPLELHYGAESVYMELSV